MKTPVLGFNQTFRNIPSDVPDNKYRRIENLASRKVPAKNYYVILTVEFVHIFINIKLYFLGNS